MRRTLVSLLLSLLLVVTSHSAAVARGSAPAVDQIVICSGTTVVTVYLDADGAPTQTPHLCPDCALHLFAALLPSTPYVTQTSYEMAGLGWSALVGKYGSVCSRATARAPPF